MLRVVAARALIPRGSLRVATLCSPASSPYAVLGVRPTATDDEVKARFLKLVKEHHPDVNHGSAAAAQMTQQINEAFNSILQQRLAAQQQLSRPPPVWQQPPHATPHRGQEEQRRTPQQPPQRPHHAPRTRQPLDRLRDETAVQLQAKQRYAAQLRMRERANAEKAAAAEKAGAASAASQARLSAAAATAARSARRKAARKSSA